MNKNILEIKINNCINSEILMRHMDKFYISTCDYNNDENMLYNYNIKTNTLEKIHSVDLDTFFFCDEISKTIYKCRQVDEELYIYKMYNKKFTCIYSEKLMTNSHLSDIYSIDNNIFIKLQNEDTDLYESYLILDNKKYKIDNKYFSDSIHRPNYMNYNNKIFLILDESNFETYEFLEIVENDIENFNRITLYNLDEFVGEIKNNKEISKKILIESECNKKSVKLLGVYKNNIIVFYNKKSPEILLFDINGNSKSIKINYNIVGVIEDDELYYIYTDDNQIGVLNENKEKIFSINNSNENERIDIVGVFDSKYIIYKKDYYEEEKINTYIYDLSSNVHLKYDSDFIFFQGSLI